MIGKKEWFSRRKYSGWGLTPKTWQGFLYVTVIVLLGFLVNMLPISSGLKMTVSAIGIIVIVSDILHIMATIKVDEREAKIEALAERNASWAMISALCLLIIYFSMVGGSMTGEDLMPFLLFPVMTGFIAKAVSAFVLQNKEL